MMGSWISMVFLAATALYVAAAFTCLGDGVAGGASLRRRAQTQIASLGALVVQLGGMIWLALAHGWRPHSTIDALAIASALLGASALWSGRRRVATPGQAPVLVLAAALGASGAAVWPLATVETRPFIHTITLLQAFWVAVVAALLARQGRQWLRAWPERAHNVSQLEPNAPSAGASQIPISPLILEGASLGGLSPFPSVSTSEYATKLSQRAVVAAAFVMAVVSVGLSRAWSPDHWEVAHAVFDPQSGWLGADVALRLRDASGLFGLKMVVRADVSWLRHLVSALSTVAWVAALSLIAARVVEARLYRAAASIAVGSAALLAVGLLASLLWWGLGASEISADPQAFVAWLDRVAFASSSPAVTVASVSLPADMAGRWLASSAPVSFACLVVIAVSALSSSFGVLPRLFGRANAPPLAQYQPRTSSDTWLAAIGVAASLVLALVRLALSEWNTGSLWTYDPLVYAYLAFAAALGAWRWAARALGEESPWTGLALALAFIASLLTTFGPDLGWILPPSI